MNLLIVVEKPSAVQIALIALNKNKSNFLKYKNIDIVCIFGFGLYKFNYPNKLSYKDYPLTQPIKTSYKEVSWDKSLNKPNSLHKFTPIHFENETFSIKDNSFKSEVYEEPSKKYQDVLLVVDKDHSAAFSVNQFLKNVLGYFPNIFFAPLLSLREEQVVESIEKACKGDLTEYKELSKQGEIKYYFDFNYNLNSIVFTGQILKDKGFQGYMSKYVVMLYLILLSKKNELPETISFEGIHKIAEKWKGTEKYKETVYSPVGTPASLFLIIYHLINYGFLEKQENGRYKIIESDYFVKKMFDPDLNFRLGNWMTSEEPLEEILKKIDSYLISMFSAQKKKNQKMFK